MSRARPATSSSSRRDERGSTSIELLIILPALFAVMFLGVVLNYFIPEQVFVYVTSVALVGSLWTWGMIMIAHLGYRRAVARGEAEPVSFRMPGAPFTNWLVVAFKGTGAVEYADWVTDLTITMVPSSDFIYSESGNAKAIKGFHDRIYPADVSDLGGTRPWDTIRFALCKVTEMMAKQRAAEGKDGNINVWFTGHSRTCYYPVARLLLFRMLTKGLIV